MPSSHKRRAETGCGVIAGCDVPQRTILIVWAAGLLLALAAYEVGPDDFVSAAFALIDSATGTVQRLLHDLGMRAYDVVRALALGLFAIFFVLSLIAVQRGLPARWTLFVVTLLFLILVWHEGPEASGHWTLAFLLAATGAASVTRRLSAPAALPQWRPKA
jgi:hypothetical protein